MWVPRGVDPASRDVLVEGVPAYLKPALLSWMRPVLGRQNTFTGEWWPDAEVLRSYDVAARPTPLYAPRSTAFGNWPSFIKNLPDEELLDLVDWLVYGEEETDRHLALDALLKQASSVWTIGERNGQRGLVRRVSAGVHAAATAAISQGSAGALLAEAWAACFGRGSNPEEAYEKAIKAVEEAAAPIVSPKNLKATLGTMVRDAKAQMAWKLDLPGTAQDVPISMMEALWTGQESRHGGNGYRVPTQSEAEAAVMLAVPLVHWFSSGAVARRP